jgi:hypothetical protein
MTGWFKRIATYGWFNKLARLFLFLTLFSFLTIHYFSNLKGQWFHIDEYHFIRKSYYFDLFFIKRDFLDPRWYVLDEPAQPKLGPYFYGLTLHLAGVDDIEKRFEEIGFNTLHYKGDFWWKRLWKGVFIYEQVPEELDSVMSMVWLGRKTSVFFTLGVLFLVFILGTKMKSILFGSISVVLLGLNGLMFSYGRMAMTDSMQLFFFIANILLVFYYLDAAKNGQRKKAIFISFLMGTNAAFAMGVKIIGILVLIFLIILFFILFISKPIPKYVSILFHGFFIVILSFWMIFVIFHPYLRDNTPERFFNMFSGRLEWAKQDQLIYPASAVNSRFEAVDLIVGSTLLSGGRYINFKKNSLPIDLVLFIVGLIMMIGQIVTKFQKGKVLSFETVFLLWSFVVIGSVIFYLQTNWPRYFLPTVSIVAIIQSYAITVFIHKISHRVRRLLLKNN